MKDKRSLLTKIVLVLGALLVLAAAALLIYFKVSEKNYKTDNASAVSFIESVIPETEPGVIENRSNPVMPAFEFEGEDYIGIFEYERFGVKLPVKSRWSKRTAKYTPCLFCGSAYDGTIVIGGGFDFVADTDIGDKIKLTDMKGTYYTYKVASVKHSKNASSETLCEGEFDLTFFARSAETKDYIIVRCNVG